MVVRRQSESSSKPTRRRPATTPEGREKQLIAMAQELAEKRIREGTASAQEITHFLKLGSSRERLEQQRLVHENELLEVKTKTIASEQHRESLYKEAIEAMQRYSGRGSTDPMDEFDG